ncbi:tyrosyl-tRNA synthetase [Sanguibacter gelidistatuariae]|uniref:Tyrosine--tRNA ligase n=1 Tax=Sanguibacter gelidistatuariae TaxID=1814289 RepID=A0A1G6P5A7_9MICO|nr:tyrosine--tRNA ligase [Sanguibacter gelidistatuariae]SDC75178.1 tyrosyl-tRNA synthetase [Sanguibacter gelidistatuariae]
MSNVLDELTWRGLVAQTTDVEALREALESGPITYYCGFDPTGPSLHHGHLVQLIVLRHLQLAGHNPIALVGGATGLIGDPRMSGERVLNSKETVAGWVERLQAQASRFLSFEGENAARMVNNLDWTGELSAIDFLRDIGKHFRLGTMLAKETVARRLASDEGVSFTEFSYQILQGMDFLELNRRHGCTLQTGGNDQWGNLLAGVELIRKSDKVAVHAMTTPLITKADGTKFGKTEGGAVWLAPDMMSPYAFYQYWINAADADVVGWVKTFTFRTREEIAEIEQSVAERPQAREAQKILAGDVTTMVHGERATAQAIAASSALFGRGELADLDPETIEAAVAELPSTEGGVGTSIIDVMISSGLVASKAAARRAVAEGGAYVNNIKVTADDAVLTADDLLDGRFAVLRRGKKTLAVVRVAQQ